MGAAETAAPDLLNFRDLGNASTLIRQGCIFRSACPVDATADDIAYIQNTLGVHTVIDLRAPEEVAEFGQAPVLAGATMITHKRRCVTFLGPIEMQSQTEQHPGQAPGRRPFTIHLLSVLDKARYVRTLLPRIPFGTAATALAMQLYDSQRGRDMLVEEVNRGGLHMLYEMILLASMMEFATAMKVVLAAVEANEPVMFYCKAGKDRTGLLAMLILNVCRVPDSDIVADYHISDAHGTVALGDLVTKKEVQKLDRGLFAKAPEEAMRHALHTIRLRYGDVSAYLEACGFSIEEQKRMRQALTVS